MNKRQIWQHRTSGERYAVELGGWGEQVVIAAAGPLHHSEISHVMMEGFDSDRELAEDIDGDQDSYDFERGI